MEMAMPDKNGKPRHIVVISGGLTIGLLLIALGTIWLLDQQGIADAGRFYPYFWSAVLIFLGLEVLNSGREKGFGAFLLFLGLFKLTGDAGLIPFHLGFKTIWPLLLIMLGLIMIFNRYKSGVAGVKRISSLHDIIMNVSASDSNDTFEHAAVFGGVEQRITSKNFKGGRLTAVFGGIEIDMSGADIAGDSAEIEVAAVFGGIEVRIPDNWVLEIRANAFLGGISNGTHTASALPQAGVKTLVVKGAVVLGGVEFKN